MGERYLERIVASGIKIGTIQTLKALGLLPEVVTISQAEKIYGRRLITEWRSPHHPHNVRTGKRIRLKCSALFVYLLQSWYLH